MPIARDKRQCQPQPRPGQRQEQTDDGEEPGQMRPATLPCDGIFRPLQGLRQPQLRIGVTLARWL